MHYCLCQPTEENRSWTRDWNSRHFYMENPDYPCNICISSQCREKEKYMIAAALFRPPCGICTGVLPPTFHIICCLSTLLGILIQTFDDFSNACSLHLCEKHTIQMEKRIPLIYFALNSVEHTNADYGPFYLSQNISQYLIFAVYPNCHR